MNHQMKRIIQMRNITLVALFFCSAELSTVLAADIKAGSQVMVIARNAKIMQGVKQVSKVTRGDVLQVAQVREDWLGIVAKKGWILKKQVVPIDLATDYFTKKIKEKPSADNYFFRGIAYLNSKKNKEAINDFNKANQQNSKKSEYLTRRGLAYLGLKQKKQAMKDFSAAIKLNSKDADAYYNRSVLFFDSHSFEKAMADLDASIKVNNQYAPAYNYRGILWKEQKKYAKAMADYSQAIKLNPSFAPPFANRGFVKKKLGTYAEAKKDYLTAIQLDPQEPGPRNDLAWLLATCQDKKHRDGKEALKQAKKACDLWRYKNFEGLDTLAAAYAETGEFKQAIQWIEKAIPIAPENEKSKLEKRKLFYKKKRPFYE